MPPLIMLDSVHMLLMTCDGTGMRIQINRTALPGGQCTWPAAFVDSAWTDTEKGELVFYETNMTGWSFEVDGQFRNQWSCVKSDTFDEDGYLLMVTVQSFVQFVTSHYYGYLCLKTKKITEVSYRYYIQAPIQRNVDYDRILINPYNTQDKVETVCLPSFGATGSEYRMLIKSGSEASAAIQCPYNFLGVFDYSHTSLAGSTTCSEGNNVWDMCEDTTRMTFDHAQCSTKVAYSDSPTVTCIDTVPVNQDNYVTVYNSGDSNVDNINTFRFACFAISSDGSKASVAPKYCRKDQSPESVPVSNSNIPLGATLTIPPSNNTCPTCPIPLSPDGGEVSVQTDGAVTTANYICADKYTLYGEKTRTCLGDNTWEFEMPACRCNEPLPPDNGVVLVSIDGFIATYSCDVGYTLNGNEKRFCQDDGKAWNGTDPVCDICDILTDPADGNVNVSLQGPTSKASYTCNVGFSLVGAKERLCLNGGAWELTEPTCNECLQLDAPVLGSINMTTDGYNSFAAFECIQGYKLTHNESLMCKNDGEWEPTKPECICEPLSPPANGLISTTDNDTVSMFSCNKRYTLNGNDTRVCLMDGTAWSGSPPSCVKCPDLQEPPNGGISVSEPGIQATANFTCLKGFTLDGSSMLSCLTNGSWDGVSPSCIQCEDLSQLNSGNVTVTTNGTVSSAIYSCAVDYTLIGSDYTLCLRDGTWDAPAPSCRCDPPNKPANGNISLSSNALTVTYSCDLGYSISGTSERLCQDDGTGWSDIQPSCSHCQTLPSLAGGTVELVTSGTITQANSSCNIGYTMIGESLLTCSSNGDWSHSLPTCNICELPISPDGGSYLQETDGKVTTTTFICPSGYALNGRQTTDCRSDGSWDYSGAICVECQALALPSSGTFILSNNGSHTIANFSCVDNYYINGKHELFCGPSGTWDESAPSCVCNNPQAPDYGTVSSDGIVAVYSCDSGYSLKGIFSRNCSANGNGWDGITPSCVSCAALSSLANGNISLISDNITTWAIHTCNVGYTMKGFNRRMCQTDGSWDSTQPECQACGEPQSPSSGSFNLTTNGTVTSALFSCVPGYEVFGHAVRECQSDGQWDLNEPICVCEAPEPPENGTIILSSDHLTVSYRCNKGYTVNGIQSQECPGDGLSWSKAAPSCVECTTSSATAGLTSSFVSNGTVSDIHYSCDKGYTMSGNHISTCQIDGQTDLPPPSCAQCATIKAPSSGTIELDTNGTTTVAVISCGNGYTLSGNGSKTCGEDGSWSGSEVLCLCDRPTTPVHGNISISSDRLTISYICETGYILVGDSVRHCANDSTGWSGTDPSCTTCQSFIIPPGASMNLSSDGSKTTAVFSCQVGASMFGNSTLICLEDGSWNQLPPTCNVCPTLIDPESGSVLVISDGQTTTAEVFCEKGYKLIGSANLTCQDHGDWNLDVPYCVCETPAAIENGHLNILEEGFRATYNCSLGYVIKGDTERQCGRDGSGWTGAAPICVTCPSLNKPVGGSSSMSTDGYLTIAHFICEIGYSLNGSTNLSCLTNQTWDQNEPNCSPCLALNPPSSGNINIASNGYWTKASYTCLPGYKLIGSSERTCSNEGVWDSNDPQCVCISPNTPSNGLINSSDDGMTITYSCKTGYSLEGIQTRHCQTDGSGWDETSPVCTTCVALDNQDGANITMTTDGSQTQALYNCDTGYSITGSSLLSCLSDGTWNISPPSCTSCQAIGVPTGGEVDLSSDGFKTAAEFVCLPGYTLEGQQNLKCKGDGSWDFLPPSCVKCSSLKSPNSGTFELLSNGLITRADFNCSMNYHIEGSNPLVCSETGTWNDIEPICACDSPPPPSNGFISSDGAISIYTCSPGYTLLGSSTRWCSVDSTWWNGTAPTCAKCKSLKKPKNGELEITTDGIISRGQFNCSIGYTLNGSESGVCSENGTWDISSPNCEECQALQAPASGYLSLLSNGTVTSAEVSCLNGYHVHGNSKLTCDSNGVWDMETPTCVCDEPPSPVNGSLSFSEDRLTVTFICDIRFTLRGTNVLECKPDGGLWSDVFPTCVECAVDNITTGLALEMVSDGSTTNVVYSCGVGYSMIGTPNISCQPNGSLESSPPKCEACPPLSKPASGNLTLVSNGTVSEGTYTCSSGYALIGDAKIICENGAWSGSEVRCECNPPTPILYGNLTMSEDNQTVTYTCEVGRTLVGPSNRECQVDGTGWSSSEPSCVQCDIIGEIINGNVTYSTNGTITSAQFACDTGGSMVGSAQLTCLTNGQWDKSPPACVMCPSLPNPDSGYLSITTTGEVSQALVTCAAEYHSVDPTMLVCTTSGVWNSSSPLCVCDKPRDITNGYIDISTDGQKATYTCAVGFTLNGSIERVCGSNGSGWLDIDPSCVPCPGLNKPIGGSFTLSTDNVTTSARFQCDVGFSMSGSAFLGCLSTGIWNDSAPTCVSCLARSDPDSGNITISSYGLLTRASYACATDYMLFGEAESECLSNGSWSSNEPRCVCKPPNTPAGGNINVSDDGMIIQYTCEEGYTLTGTNTRNCQTDGSGWDESNPSCTACDALQNVVGGSVQLKTDGIMTVAELNCDDGYSMAGDSTLTCRNDGTWNMSQPTCTLCQPLQVQNDVILDTSTDGKTTQTSFNCLSGYALQGELVSACRGDGTWDHVAPICVQCQNLTVPDSGFYFISTNGSTSIANFSCAEGYYLEGKNLLTCDSNGMWNYQEPSCKCQALSAPIDGYIELLNDGLTVMYNCSLGFTLVGAKSRTCMTDGSGWDGADPICERCDAIENVENGNITLINDGRSAIAVFTCGIGSTLNGSSVSVCDSNGSWNKLAPVCAVCPNISQPSNGEVALTTDGATTIAQFVCHLGFSINGSSSLSCGTEGTWSSEYPYCVKCSVMIAPANSQLVFSTTDTVTIASFVCDSGYYLKGSSEITCMPDGTWDSELPTCICNKPTAPANGSVWTSADGLTSVFSCSTGYSLMGFNTSVCGNDSSGWTNQEPTCVECQPLSSLDNGNTLVETDGTTTVGKLTCAKGFRLNGVSTIICETTGFWQTEQASCVECEHLPQMRSGSVTLQSDGHNTLAIYACVSGYSLSGTTIRSCSETGTWNGTEPVCTCNMPPSLSNGNITLLDGQMTALYKCDSGYTLNGASVRTCQDDGSGWNGTDPSCSICTTAVNPTGGSVKLQTDGYITKAVYECDVEYSLEGNEILTCRADGTWDLTPPSCVLCQALEKPSNGSIQYSSDGHNTIGIVTCSKGFSMVGANTLFCLSNGRWNSSVPTCSYCPDIRAPDSGAVEVRTDGITTKANLSCSTGYTLIGNDLLTCGIDGTWSDIEPICNCEPPQQLQDGYFNLTLNNSLVTYTCNIGFTIKGNSVRMCQVDGGGWNGSQPTCVSCENITPPDNSSYIMGTSGIVTQATFACDIGFTILGQQEIQCQDDGTWDFSIPSCVQCDNISIPEHGNVSIQTNRTVSVAKVTCDTGFTLSEGVHHTIACSSSGSWDIQQPTCARCSNLTDIQNGQFSIQSNGTFTVAAFECQANYYLSGESTIICGGDGEWDNQQPVCLCNSPPTPLHGIINTNGFIVSYECIQGYSIKGNTIRVCQHDGSGWNGTSPSCNACQVLPEGQLLSYTDSTNGLFSKRSYTCPLGYSLKGNATILCLEDGTWTSGIPECVHCQNLSSIASGMMQIDSNNVSTYVSYICSDKYYITGQAVRYCLDSGEWDGNDPTCICNTPAAPLHGRFLLGEDKMSATFTCEPGYTLSGHSMVSCLPEGKGWNYEFPNCTLCDTLTIPTGASVEVVFDVTKSIATYLCETGSTINGPSSVECRDDGTWNTSAPNCAFCPSVTSPLNGNVTVMSNGKLSSASYICDLGFVIDGKSNIECTSFGKWESTPPVCVECPSLTTPESGSMLLWSNGFNTYANISCADSYSLVGDPLITCETNGVWDKDMPICYCNDPVIPVFGHMLLTHNQSEAIFSCQKGYTLKGSRVIYCNSDGSGWSSISPTCEVCEQLDDVKNGSMVTSSNGTITIASFSCQPGTSLNGTGSLECGTTGKWTSNIPTCVPCPSIENPVNGTVLLDTDGYISTATYRCNQEYTLKGIQHSICSSNGEWNIEPPICVHCATLDDISSGSFELSTNGSMTFASFTCAFGYTLVGWEVIICREDGTWDHLAPKCVCDAPFGLDNGEYTILSDTMTAEYACNIGYTLRGSSIRSCSSDRSGWSDVTPTCVECDAAPSIESGVYNYITNGTTSTLNYSCTEGYTMKGSQILTCKEDGLWDIVSPQCVLCPGVQPVESGVYTTLTNGTMTSVQYSCNSGYQLIGSSTIHCLEEGIWDSQPPVCRCLNPDSQDHGTVDANGTVAIYTCNTGFSLNGVAQRICKDDGTGWSNNSPICVPCNTLQVSSGGNMSLESNGQITSASFTCDIGYTLDGLSLLNCSSAGLWSSMPPSCGNPCNTLSTPGNGSVTLLSDGKTTTALFECTKGSSMHGSNTITCRTDGSWDMSEPNCVTCPPLPEVPSGNLSITTDGSTTMAVYTCVNGYHLEGSAVIACTSDGIWNTSLPVCKCDLPDAPTFGSYTVLTGNNDLRFSCENGYSVKGSSELVCLKDGSGYNGPVPECVYCEEIPPLSHGSIQSSTDGVSSMITLTCDVGFTLKGAEIVACNDQGKWNESTSAECVECLVLSPPDNGFLNVTTTGTVTVAAITCEVNYSLRGDQVSTCQYDGTWDGGVPTCVSCTTLTTPDSGYLMISSNGSFTTADFSCQFGYTLLGQSVLTCLQNGDWNWPTPECVCSQPYKPTDGNIILSDNGYKVSSICNRGYSLSGNPHRSCQPDGTGWNGSSPVCVPCSSPSTIVNGDVDVETDGVTTSASYNCSTGFRLEGEHVIICLSSGVWSTNPPKCVPCPILEEPESGRLAQISDGRTTLATFTCLDGYTLIGNAVLACLSNSSWNATEPICVCNTPLKPLNGHVYSDGLTAIYSCRTGFTMKGVERRYCGTDGSGWNETEPTCTTCEPLDTDGSVTIHTNTTGIDTHVYYSCDAGYTLKGVTTSVCRSDGSWDVTPPVCVGCQTLDVPDNGNVSVSTDSTKTKAIFTCDIGYTLKGTSKTMCRSDGTWDFAAPTCVECQSLISLSSGSVVLSTNGIFSTAKYSCSPGYDLHGETDVECSANGNWNSSAPVCKCIEPSTPTFGRLELVNDNTTTKYSCEIGYTLSGPAVRHCLEDGSGWDGVDPECKSCSTFNHTNNGNITLNTNGTTTTLDIQCDVGATVYGSTTVECNDNGNWTGSIPSCAVCPALTRPANGDVLIASDGTTSYATFSCNLNYSLAEIYTSVCGSGGNWEQSIPECVHCQPITSLDSGIIQFSTNGTNTKANFTCLDGYYIQGSSEIECLHNGTWSNQMPTCVCTLPENVANSDLLVSVDKFEALYSCHVGYTMLGGNARYCQQEGLGWLPDPPICVKCDDIPRLRNGSIEEFNFGNSPQAIFKCDIGFTLVGDQTLTCATDGSWNTSFPFCVECATLLDINSGYINYETDGWNTKATYQCINGYSVVGVAERLCNESGSWELTEPSCKCDYPEAIQYGNITLSDDGHSVIYDCEVGYSINGTTKRICLADGIGWSEFKPSCVLCDTLTAPPGGTVEIISDGHTTFATVNCSLGFSMDGPNRLLCREDGSWNSTMPVCRECSTLELSIGATVDVQTDGIATIATFNCIEGYTLVGAATVECKQSGAWNFATPTCTRCPDLLTPPNAQLNLTTDGLTSEAYFECPTDYFLFGSPVLICQMNGNWSSSAPHCKCVLPPVPDHASMNVSSDGLEISYTCNVGYTLNGNRTLTCLSDGSGWNADAPSCSKCDDLGITINGSFDLSVIGTTTIAVLVCDKGSTLSGAEQLTCGENGTWDLDQPSCAVCPDLGVLDNGTVDLISNGSVSMAYFTCRSGYSLKGISMLTCGTNGEWDNNQPTCNACSSVLTPSSGDVNIMSNGSNSLARFTCKVGYEMIGTSEITCLSDGSWDGSEPMCVCIQPGSISNGDIIISLNRTVANYICNNGFTLDGTATRFCKDDGSGWAEDEPKCVKCQDLENPPGGSLNFLNTGTQMFANVTCPVGSTVNGGSQLTCGSDGTWDMALPTCETCNTLTPPTNGHVNITSNGIITTAMTECAVGYTLSGSPVTTCRFDGSWSFNLPSCVKCPDLSNPTNGNVSVETDGQTTTALFTCTAGYHIFGEAVLSCNILGDWNFTEPQCVCDVPASLSNGGYNLSLDRMSITYYCEPGFTLKGNFLRHCQLNSMGWDSADPTCVMCDSLQEPIGIISNLSTNGRSTSKKFSCNAGSSLKGSNQVTCKEDGTWDSELPTCVECPSVSSPKSGSFALDTNGVESVSVFMCNAGYTILGSVNVTCDIAGTWSDEFPKCVCELPPIPSNGQIQVSEDRMSIEYVCEDSYTLKGNKELMCDANGSGWNSHTPICVQCNELEITSGMTKKYKSDGIHSILEFSCDTGYTLAGAGVAVCNDTGTWNIESPPICVHCQNLTSPIMGDVVIITNGTRSTAVYSCQSGYHVHGKVEIVCTDIGLWDVPPPVCHCDAPPNITNGDVISNGLTAVYSCLKGFTLNGNLNRLCQFDGSGWTGTSPTCIPCQSLGIPVDGQMEILTNGSLSKTTFQCNLGYTLKGTSQAICTDDGLWNELPPICVHCPPLGMIDSGNITLKTDGKTSTALFSCMDGYEILGTTLIVCNDIGTWNSAEPVCVCSVEDIQNGAVQLSDDMLTAYYSCDTGFSLKGQQTRTCLSNGLGWDQELPVCVQCIDLPFSSPGVLTFKVDGLHTRADFRCNPGYTLNGLPSLLCNSEGSWSGEPPVCVSCPVLTDPASGTVNTTSNGSVSKAEYSCYAGYYIKGEPTRSCDGNGTWVTPEPICVCQTPLSIPNGAFVLNNSGMTASYTCDIGYSLQGVATRECLQDGTGWDTASPTCNRCTPLETLDNGNVELVTAAGTTVALFTCQTGCTISGQSMLICLSDGTWDFSTPSCACCPTLSSVSSSTVNLSSDGFITTAGFECATGYSLIGAPLLSCRSNGLWNFETPSCLCDAPEAPVNTTVTLSNGGSHATYTCGIGYSLIGSSQRSCLIDGTGWEGTEPTCKKCSDISKPENGTMVFSTDGAITYVDFKCNHGYSLTGPSNISCIFTGKWDQEVPNCVKCPALNATTGLRYTVISDGITTRATIDCASGFELLGQTSLTCLQNGSWDALQPTCMVVIETTTAPVICSQSSSSTGGTVGVAVALSLIIVALLVALGVLWRLYRRQKEIVGRKSQLYSTDSKPKGVPHPKAAGLETDITKLSLSTFDDIEIFSRASAPVGHQRHVLEMGRTQSSFAPSGHQKHLLELAGQTTSPAPVSFRGGTTPARPPTTASIGFRNKSVSQASRSYSPFDMTMLTPTPRSILKGSSASPSPVPSTDGQEYDSMLPQQILTPREVPITDRVSPKPTPTADKRLTKKPHQPRQKSSSPKASKRKKATRTLTDSGSFTPRSSEASPNRSQRSVNLSGLENRDTDA